MKSKRVLVVSDFHCGHLVGLTPPGFDADREPQRHREFYDMRRTIWKWFARTVSKLAPIDILIVNGDAVDGKGPASGGTEQLYADRNDQSEMAAAVIRTIDAKKVVMSYGTPYHTGVLEDWEDAVARDVGAEKIGGEDVVDVNGLIINYRHHVGRSTIPHGRFTPIAKEMLWNLLWAERGEYPKANVLIRSHVHYHVAAQTSDWLAMTTPALQGYGTKYGGRRITGTVDIGVIVFDVTGRGEYTWRPELLRLQEQRPVSL
jgi:hypothetical protein